MIEPLEGRTPPMTPQLALRVAIVGTVALVMFALIFFRLWFLQVLSGNQYVAAAASNITRPIPVAAPRGEILSSNGTVLVGSSPVPAVEIAPPNLPVPVTLANIDQKPAKDYVVYDELAHVLQMSTQPKPCKYTIYLASGPKVHVPELAPIPCLIAQGIANQAYANVTIKTDVSPDIQAYLAEHQSQSQFQGVLTQQVYLRNYPQGDLAAQMLGTVGAITSTEVGKAGFKGAHATDIVGQSGLEYSYDQYLLGTDGADRVKVNADNQFQGYATPKKPVPGDNLKTSIDLNLQKVGEQALAHSIATTPGAVGGAFLALDPETGQIYAMGSNPTYDPSIFTHPISQKTYDKDFGAKSGNPLINRVIDSPLPDGSTFKVITATAALESGAWSLNDTYDDDAEFCLGTFCVQNSGGAHYGVIGLQQAIEVSDDEFFYNLGAKLNVDTGDGGALQKWASLFGLGHTTGVDLPGEANGEIGSPKLQAALYKLEIDCQNATGPYKGQAKTPAKMAPDGEVLSGGCAIATAPYWTEGDNVETGVGQYDDQVTPLQLAVVYAAIANGGTIVTPHIGEDIQTSSGEILEKIDPAPKRKLAINPTYLAAIQQGLRLAASGSQGTSADVMGDFPKPVYGKTGTAELGDSASSPEDAWYACYVPASATSKPIVVVVNVEKGGFGDVAAAPVARQILSQWFYGKPGVYKAGTNTDL